MTTPWQEAVPARRPWLVIGAALVAGFIAAGTFATSKSTALIFVFSLALAAFLGVLAYSIFTDSDAPLPEKDEDGATDSIRATSV